MQKLSESFGAALAGVKLAWIGELNFRIEVTLGALALGAAWWLDFTRSEFLILFLTIGFVLAVEVLNTALEELCDKHTLEHDPHIARIKDLAASAVLLVSFTALAVGITLFLPHIL